MNFDICKFVENILKKFKNGLKYEKNSGYFLLNGTGAFMI